ncbi:MAG: FecR domain-containing protein [candidate division WS1 bacterium]|nr:FecR domain-containing protein [candidate division WS1 bacterium]
MLLRRKRQTQAPASDREALEQAFSDLAQEQEAQARKAARRRRRVTLPAWLDRRVLCGLLAVLTILVADGVRRQNGEFFAEIIDCVGDVTLTDGDGDSIAAKTGGRLTSGAVVQTGSAGRVVLELADGTRLVVVAGSRIDLTALDYNRGGDFRDHTFALHGGRVMAAVSDRFGAQSDLAVATPGAVAAVRGTTFLAEYDPSSRLTRAASMDGSVDLSANGFMTRTVSAGTMAYAAADGGLSEPWHLPEDIQGAFRGEGELALPPSEDPLMRRIEYPLLRILDPVLSILGIGRSSWGVLAGNAARRSAATQAAQDIWQDLETQQAIPPRVTLSTLEELSLPESKRKAVINQLAGNRLQGYIAGNNSYAVLLRAKDRNRTPILVTPAGVQDISRSDAPLYEALRQCGVQVTAPEP